MILKEFKEYISMFSDDHQFQYGISEPFSWRGSYDQVAFSIITENMTKQEILNRIQMAYENVFYGWKGGEYEYDDFTFVNFERQVGSWSDGGYVREFISNLLDSEEPATEEERLVKLAFI